MLIGLLGISYALLPTIMYLRPAGRKFYNVFSVSTVVWLGLLFVITEGLSLFNLISTAAVAVSWSIVIAVEAAVLALIRKPGFMKGGGLSIRDSKTLYQSFNGDLLFGALLVITALLLLRSTWVAVFTVPNNYDSMTYHLPRIIYWLKHGNVNYFDTVDSRLCVSPVLGEYINLHIIALAGNDVFVNMVQNASGYLCVVYIYGIIRELGCGRKTALTGGLMMLSMNIFSAEAVSTQVDVFASMLLLAVSLLLIQTKDKKIAINRRVILYYLLIGVGGGLIFIAKNNSAVSAGIVALMVILIRLFSKDRFIDVGIICLIAISAASAIVAPTFLRNYSLSGDILAMDYMGGIAIGSLSPRLVVVNMVKNFGSVAVNDHNVSWLHYIVHGFGRLMGVDVDNPLISFNGLIYNNWTGYTLHMDRASASIMAMLIVLSSILAVLFFFTKKRTMNYLISMMLLFQFFVSIAIIRWQPWVVRLLLPSLALVIPGVVYLLYMVKAEITERCHSSVAEMLISFMLILTVFVCIGSSQESYLFLKKPAMKNLTGESSRFDLYFYYSLDPIPYNELCEAISGTSYDKLGIYLVGGLWRYPVLYTLYKETEEIEEVVLQNAEDSAEKGPLNPEYSPDVIAVIGKPVDAAKKYMCNGSLYECIYSYDGGDYSAWIKVEG